MYFCDFGKYQNPVPAGETAFASDANVAYKRSALDAIKPVWKEKFHETSVNWALREHGGKLVLSPDMVLYQHRLGLRLGTPCGSASRGAALMPPRAGGRPVLANGWPMRLFLLCSRECC